jgi:uncharacterized protein
MPRISTSIRLCLALLACLAAQAALAAPALVDDQADLLSGEQRDRIALHHSYLLQDFDVDYRLVTVRAVDDIVIFGAEQFEALDVGGLSRSGRGLLLIIDPLQDRVRLEVGHALEGVFPDAFVAYIQQRQMVPFFQADRVADGILATTELIVRQAQEAAARNGFDTPDVSGSSGAGATARARIGQSESTLEEPGHSMSAGISPAMTLQAYFDAMRSRDSRAELDLYTAATQRMLQNWVMTPAQMDNVLRTYRSCSPEAAKMSSDQLHAVIRYPASERRCSPWFFEREQERWKLDFTVMQDAIRFGRDNSWRFADGVPGRYEFAFRDWEFDRHGFPKAR